MKIVTKFRPLLAVVLCLSMVNVGCSAAQFITVLNEVTPAVLTVLQIVALFKGTPVDTTIPTKIQADVTALEKLYTDYQAAAAADQPGIRNEITSAFAVLNADIGSVLTIAQVKDPATQAKIEALIALIQTAVTIAEAVIPPSASSDQLVRASKLTPGDFVDSYNKILTAKTGIAAVDAFTPKHRIHIHSKLTRVLTFGLAK